MLQGNDITLEYRSNTEVRPNTFTSVSVPFLEVSYAMMISYIIQYVDIFFSTEKLNFFYFTLI